MRAWIGAFLGLAGVAFGLTLVYRAMRSVMEIGGTCADGGPYVVANPCPEGIPLLMLLGIFGGIASLGVFGWSVSKLGPGYSALLLWAWPALFVSLGWNFLEFGFDPPAPAEGVELGWIVCGVLFWLMGGVPALVALRSLPRTLWPADPPATPPSAVAVRPPAAGSQWPPGVEPWTAAPDPGPVFDGHARVSVKAPGAVDVVARLERLAALRQRGELTDAQYEQAKQAVLSGD